MRGSGGSSAQERFDAARELVSVVSADGVEEDVSERRAASELVARVATTVLASSSGSGRPMGSERTSESPETTS
jgi:predicted regulator of Ras-like GTPase activity (Roadblock/LC7/MglB family)